MVRMRKTMNDLDYNQAHEYVNKSKTAFWHGWDLVLFTPTKTGASHPKGMRRNGEWGIAYRVSPNEEGRWTFR